MYLACRNSPVFYFDYIGLHELSTGSGITSPRTGTFAEAVKDFLDGGPAKHYLYEYPDSATERLLLHPDVDSVWQKFLNASCGKSRSFNGSIKYVASGGQFLRDIWTIFGTYEMNGQINLANNYARDFGYEVLGSFTGKYTIRLDCEKCQKFLSMKIDNEFTMASLTRIPFVRVPLISRNLLNPVRQTFVYDVVKPAWWRNLEMRSR